MRVLLAHKFFRTLGGGERFFFETGRMLEGSGHQVAYMSTRHPDNASSPFSSYFVKAFDYHSPDPIERARGLAASVYYRKARQSMTRLLKDFRPDIVHVFSIFSHLSTSILDACVQQDVPVVMSCNDYKHICPNYRLYHHGKVCEDCRGGRFYKAITNRCCHESLLFSAASAVEAYSDQIRGPLARKVDLFLFASEFMAQATTRFWGEGSYRWRILRNPFTSTLSSTPDDAGYLLFFGRLIKEKGVQQLLQAATLMPEVEVRVVGDGDYEQALRDQAAASALTNVTFLGPLWGEEMDEALAGARAVIVPSVWHENFPYVILQAFAAGKAVIGTDRGGIPEMIEHGVRGLVYPAEDPVSLVSTVRRLWSDPGLRERMGAAAHEYLAREYGTEKFMSSLMEAYKAATSQRTIP